MTSRISPGWMPGGHLDLVLAPTERRDAHRATEQRGRERELHARVQRATLAREERMRRDLDLDVEVAGARTLPARLALATLRDAVAVLEPCRYVDVELAPLDAPTLAPAVAARVADAASRRAARVAACCGGHPSERGADHALHASRTAAARAAHRGRSVRGALAGARVAGGGDLDADPAASRP